MLEVLAPVWEELLDQEMLVQRALDGAGGYRRAEVSAPAGDRYAPSKYLRPALVLLTSRLYRHRPETVVPLAAVHQFIYLAGRTHAGVAEVSEHPREDYQFPVLVGDYLYGRFFATLSGAGMGHLLGDLARVICAMNEGGMMRAKNALGLADYDIVDIIRLETAELAASCCRLGGLTAGAPRPDLDHLHNMGLEIGLALGHQEEGHSLTETAGHLQRALNELALLFGRRASNTMERFIRLLAPGVEGSGYPTEGRVLAG